MLASLLLAAPMLVVAAPAAATGQQQVSITVAHRWGTASAPGVWSPYTVTIRNAGASTFEGDVVMVPNQSSQNGAFGPVVVQSLPTYRAHVSVPNGSDRAVTMYLVEAGSGYHAELHDANGQVVASAGPAPAPSANGAVGVLSDVAGAAQKIGAPLSGLSQINVAVTGFAGARDFPSNAVELAGLNGLILDQFDVSALDQAQQRALRDFVALGGALIEVGGASWRRTFAHLPPELVPMAPAGTSTSSIRTVVELAGQKADSSAQVATGHVAAWARVAVAAPDGQPLLVEGAYGSGRVVELAFDPLEPPFDTQPSLAVISWTQAIARGLGSNPRPSFTAKPFVGPGPPALTPVGGAGPGAWSPDPALLWQVLSDSATSASPPVGLLAGLFAAYVLALTLGSYALLKVVGRRGLLWLTVPALAVAVTGGAYAAGFGGRASAVQVSETQIQLVGPGGVVETYSYDGVFSPRKGDVSLAVPVATLASTAMPTYGGPGNGPAGADITVSPSHEVVMHNVPVWEMRAMQTLSISHPAALQGVTGLPILADLHVTGGRVRGSLTNATGRPLRELRLASAAASTVDLAPLLGPGASATVDVALPAASTPIVGKGAFGPGVSICGPGIPCGQTVTQGFLSLASQQASTSPGQLALIADTDPIDTIGAGARRAASSSRALLVEPVRLSDAEQLGSLSPLGRLVSSYPAPSSSGQLDVYELALPGGRLAGGVSLNTTSFTPAAQSVEVYDWDAQTWRASSPPGRPATAATTSRLTAGELSTGVVRVRVVEDSPGQVGLSLSDAG